MEGKSYIIEMSMNCDFHSTPSVNINIKIDFSRFLSVEYSGDEKWKGHRRKVNTKRKAKVVATVW